MALQELKAVRVDGAYEETGDSIESMRAEALRYAKLGRPLANWFSQTPPGPRVGELKEFAVVAYTILVSRLARVPRINPSSSVIPHGWLTISAPM